MIKFLFYISIFLISGIESLAQSDSILIRKYSKSGKILLEEYFISIDSTKNGPYKKFNEKGKRLMEGQYFNGNPTGIWLYYEDNNWNRPYSKFDWSTLKEIEYYHTSNRQGTNSPDSICRFPGGEMVYQHYLSESINRITTKHVDTKGKAKISFKIGSNGKAILNEIEWFDKDGKKQPINIDLESDLIALIENLPAWIFCSEEKSSKFLLIQPIVFK